MALSTFRVLRPSLLSAVFFWYRATNHSDRQPDPTSKAKHAVIERLHRWSGPAPPQVVDYVWGLRCCRDIENVEN